MLLVRERIDDAVTRIDRGFESLRDEMREMRVELREFRGEMVSDSSTASLIS